MVNRKTIVIFVIYILLKVSNIVCVKCPDASQWNLKEKGFCNSTRKFYYCLYDENKMTYTEFCRKKPDYQRPGYKFVISGHLDGKICEVDRFQPFKFWTNRSSDCIYRKSNCMETGQISADEGNSVLDRTCRCDYTIGYAFVTNPRNGCSCNPNVEDCSCFRKTCLLTEVLNPDYNCVTPKNWTGNFNCPDIVKDTKKEIPSLQATTSCPTIKISGGRQQLSNMKMPSAIALTVVVVLGVILVTLGWKLKVICDYKMEKTVDTYFNMIQEKNKQRAVYKEIICSIKPRKVVKYLVKREVLSSDDEEQISACLKRSEKNLKLLTILSEKGKIYEEFVDALQDGDSYTNLVTLMKNTTDDVFKEFELTDEYDNVEELYMLYNEKVPKNVRVIHDKNLNAWKEEEKMFEITEGAKQVEKKLLKDNCVLIIGRPGSGKSAIIRHLALKLCGEGYDVIPIVVDPRVLLEYHQPSRNQVFLIDNFCGKNKINTQSADLWESYIQHILYFIKGDTKFLISCETTIYDDDLFKTLKSHLEKYVCQLKDFPLNDKEKANMLKKYVSLTEPEEKKLTNLKTTEFDIPLLCKLSERSNAKETIEMFTNPLAMIRKDIEKMKDQDKRRFCLMTLIALFDNNFDEAWLCNDDVPKKIQKAIEDVCLDFNLEIKNESTRLEIKTYLEKMEKKYVTKSGSVYHFIHEQVYNVAAVVCGLSCFYCFINHASSLFIGERFWFESNGPSELKQTTIPVYHRNENLYFNRLFSDISAGDTYSTFHNIQLEDSSYREKFFDYCRENKSTFESVLNQINRTKSDDHSKHSIQLPLLESASRSYADMVEFLLKEMNCDVNQTDRFGRSALFLASSLGHLKVVEVLIENGADVKLCDKEHNSPLYIACAEGKKDIVERLLRNNKEIMTIRNMLGLTPLLISSTNEHAPVVDLLLKNGADIVQADNDGCTALHMACREGYKKIVQSLISSDKKILSVCDRHDKSAFYKACAYGQYEIVSLLLEHVDINQVARNDKKTPLYIACQRGHKEVVKILLEKGADTTLSDRQGRSPFYIACKAGQTEIVKILKPKVNISEKNKWCETPLDVACREGHLEVIKVLVQTKEDCKNLLAARDSNERSPFYNACKNGRKEIVDYLLKMGADKNEMIKDETWAGFHKDILDILK